MQECDKAAGWEYQSYCCGGNDLLLRVGSFLSRSWGQERSGIGRRASCCFAAAGTQIGSSVARPEFRAISLMPIDECNGDNALIMRAVTSQLASITCPSSRFIGQVVLRVGSKSAATSRSCK